VLRLCERFKIVLRISFVNELQADLVYSSAYYAIIAWTASSSDQRFQPLFLPFVKKSLYSKSFVVRSEMIDIKSKESGTLRSGASASPPWQLIRPGAKSSLRSGSVDSNSRLLTSTFYPATDFITSPSQQTCVSVSLLISMEGLNSMREKLLMHDKYFMKFIGNSKNTVAMKSSFQVLFIAYQTVFITLVAGYVQVANQLFTSESKSIKI